MDGWEQAHFDLVHATAWPPSFVEPLWKWLSGLSWPQSEAPTEITEGISFLELLFNFVAVTNTLPPVRTTDGTAPQYVDPLSPEGILQPLYIRTLLVTLTAATRRLEKLLGRPFFQGRPCKHVATLALWQGEPPGRKGLLLRPGLMQAQQTCDVLLAFARTRSTECLRDLALQGSRMIPFSPEAHHGGVLATLTGSEPNACLSRRVAPAGPRTLSPPGKGTIQYNTVRCKTIQDNTTHYIQSCVRIYVYVYLFVCLYVCMSVGLSVCLSLSLSLCLSVSLSVSLSVCMYVFMHACMNVCHVVCVCVYVCPYVCTSGHGIFKCTNVYVHLSNYLSIYLHIHLPTYLSTCLFIYLPTYLTNYPFIH